MMDEEDRKIKAWELKHKEAMTYLHIFSWIIFTSVVALSIIPISISASGGQMKSHDLTLLNLVIAAWCIVWVSIFVKQKNDATVSRDNIFKLEENKTKKKKQKEDKK